MVPKPVSGRGDYYQAPSVKFAKAGPGGSLQEMIYVDENGHNHYGMDNIFKTQLKTFGLALSYDSRNARDNYYTMGHWRNSFVSYLDFPINADDIVNRSDYYDTPRDACERGFADIKGSVYRGIFAQADAVYDKSSDMCIIKNEGEDVGRFVVWNRSKRRDDLHYLTTPKGDFYLFLKDKEGTFTAEQDGVKITLQQDANGTFSYKDAHDVLWRYDKQGRLAAVIYEGEESTVVYNEQGAIAEVRGPLNNTMHFTYDDNGLLHTISMHEGEKALYADLAYNTQKMLSSFRFVMKDENSTEHTLAQLQFSYNDKNLLSEVYAPERDAPDGKGEPMEEVRMAYTYDNLNRVTMRTSNAYFEQYRYGADSVVKILPDGTEATAVIDFKGSKQIVREMDDAHISSQLKYNKTGQLSELYLEESIDANGSQNIASNALRPKRTLRLQMDYNPRGLIRSQYLEMSDGTKKFTNFEYKTRYNKPTKVLTNSDVTFFDFNNKGQIIKMSYLKYDKEMKIKPDSLEEIRRRPGYKEVVYTYDENGFVKTTTDTTTQKQTHYMTMKNGETIPGNIASNGIFDSWFWTNFFNYWIKGSLNGEIYDVRDGNTKLAIISGAGGDSMKYLYYQNRDISKNFHSEHFYWEQISFSRYMREDIFGKGSLGKLVVIGHSYGGDSAVEGACAPRLTKKVDLLITVDPVGIQPILWYTRSRTKYWINLYADPGRQWPGVKIRWKCRWWGCYPKIYHLKSQWNRWDWIAWFGGKGTYSSYGRYVPANKRKTVRAHHDESDKMLDALRKDGPNYNFNLNL